MNKIILLTLTALVMAGCNEEMDRTTKMVQFKTLQIDSCEYLKVYGCYVKYISKVNNIPQGELWKAIYDIALREITLIYGQKEEEA